ncbi:phosphoribosylaminoimidazolesuccinocarboxamide synthase [Candidatus Kinetoplastidibacterium crithidiae]|uniref:Phosphoribosylaminoimidazole-succinocarboxamide synthase n=1 Tax=Candidatus Kinetoplastidibacterium crithidiae TCC036E TaxID=1208918 RepID=M1M5H9_9PROT|nr:phosphoribosylaminoimidazolesuccinocarboxamide synthase [Candidatus Kinetoplastibacterium crithidii]AFZ83149.1 phosphoribosylaminoimidazole-succinocarboxamide synthase [Candidatus Kinetoplastibacterium crithidii (ex Angomonas deanei ATCC 30255)]AGF47425.1 phosphoribosylaminoimidazole-succinocarboxamide synthase [Candidatus Kinetoplastibacterium crithidii TCC036E]
MNALLQSGIKSLPLISRGKVRDIYAVDDDKLLIVVTDRISAFDVILDDPIPGKGLVLNKMTEFWLNKLQHIVPNHSTGIAPETVVSVDEIEFVKDRAVVVKRLKPIMIEAVVRGYLIGSGWQEYQKTGSVCGIKLPGALNKASKLEEVIFTPAAKAEQGSHDENVSFSYVKSLVGNDLANKIKDISIQLYQEAYGFAIARGIIIADTKFEFGLDQNGVLYLMDEVLTPDSSRFWPLDSYEEGSSPVSFDKQFVRDWLELQNWNKTAPAPKLPKDVIQKTSDKYYEALDRFTS